jgi:hypothetical protein
MKKIRIPINKYSARVGGIRPKGKDKDWINPATEEAKKQAKKIINPKTDEVILSVEKNDNDKLVYHEVKTDQSIREANPSNGEPLDSQSSVSPRDESSDRLSSSEDSPCVPTVRIVTRAGALNTAIKVLENNGYKAENPDEYLAEAYRLQRNIIRRNYENSKEQRSDEKHKKRRNK